MSKPRERRTVKTRAKSSMIASTRCSVGSSVNAKKMEQLISKEGPENFTVEVNERMVRAMTPVTTEEDKLRTMAMTQQLNLRQEREHRGFKSILRPSSTLTGANKDTITSGAQNLSVGDYLPEVRGVIVKTQFMQPRVSTASRRKADL